MDEFIDFMMKHQNKCFDCKDHVRDGSIYCTKCKKQRELEKETLLSVAIEIRDLLKKLLEK